MCALYYALADESGIHQGAITCVVAGYLADHDQWTEFDKQWLAALGAAGVSHFHAKEFFNRQGIYKGLPEESAAILLDGLLSCIENSSVQPFGAATEYAAFAALTYGERRFATGGLFDGSRFRTNGAPTRPYFCGFQYALVEVAKRLESDDLVHFIFADQAEYRARALETFNEAKATMEEEDASRIGLCGFLDTRKASALQAADLLNHLWYCFISYGEEMGAERSEAMDRITAKGNTLRHYNREGFEALFAGVPVEIRERLRAIQPPRKGRRG